MSELLRNHFGRYSHREREGCSGMAKIIEPDFRQPGLAKDWFEVLLNQVAFVDWPATGRGEDEIGECAVACSFY